MSLPPFRLHRPGSVAEAAGLLTELGETAVPYAGGTELLLLLKLGLADHTELVDVKRLPELRGIAADDGALRIGGIATHLEVERHPVVRERWPALAEMESRVGNLRVRATGTIGGNLCFADPHSDPATFLLAAGGEVEVQGAEGARRIRADDLVTGPFETSLRRGELLAAVHLPEPPPGTTLAHRKISFGERPAVTVAASLRVADGRIAEPRLAVGSAGLVPARAPAAEEILSGLPARELDREAIAAAGTEAADAAAPVADQYGAVDYKRHLVSVLTRRCVEAAVESTGSAPG